MRTCSWLFVALCKSKSNQYCVSVCFNVCPLRGRRYHAGGDASACSCRAVQKVQHRCSFVPLQASKQLSHLPNKARATTIWAEQACKASTSHTKQHHDIIHQCTTTTVQENGPHIKLDLTGIQILIMLKKICSCRRNFCTSQKCQNINYALIFTVHNLYEYLCLNVCLYTFFFIKIMQSVATKQKLGFHLHK